MCSPRHIVARYAAIAAIVGVNLIGLSAQARYGVEEVVDGESIRLTGIGTIRLLGVDVPKVIDGLRPWSPDTDQAVLFIRGLVAKQTVKVEYDRIRSDLAKTTVAYVYLPDGTSLNAEILRGGYGRVNSELPFDRVDEFRKYEREAQAARRGLWATVPTPAPAERPPASGDSPRPPDGVIIR